MLNIVCHDKSLLHLVVFKVTKCIILQNVALSKFWCSEFPFCFIIISKVSILYMKTIFFAHEKRFVHGTTIHIALVSFLYLFFCLSIVKLFGHMTILTP